MRKTEYFIIVLITILIVPVCIFSQEGGRMGRIDKRARDFFKSRYYKPVIEVLEGTHNKVFPSLIFYSVYEENDLIEDPLIPSIWIRTSMETFYPVSDITEALGEEGIVPKNVKEAIAVTRELLLLQQEGCYAIEGPQSFPGEIPAIYNERIFYPSVIETSRGYEVSIHLYYPDSRYAEFYSCYRKDLVEFTVTISGCDYSIQKEHVYSDEEDIEVKEIM